MNIKKLRCFRAVIINGSLGAAANVMNLSQPATSRLISTLEEELKLTLFKREKRRLVLTPEGEKFYRETERILANLDELPNIVSDIRNNTERPLRIVALARNANSLISPALARLQARHPGQRFSVDVRGHRDIEHWVAGRQYDIGVAVTLPCNHPSVSYKPFFITEAMAMMPRGHPLASLETVTARQLSGHTLVALSSGLRPRQQMEDIFRAAGVDMQCQIETTSTPLACQMVADGLGVTVIDRLAAMAVNMDNCELRPISPAFKLEFGLLFPPDHTESPIMKALVDCLTEQVSHVLGPNAIIQ